MSVYKCECGYEDDETVKCPKCGKMTISFEGKSYKPKPVKETKKTYTKKVK